MDIIELAREIGREIQKDERYLTMHRLKKVNDEDKELQELVGEFNLKKLAITQEAQKEDRSDETLDKLNKEIQDIYAKIMQNKNMIEFTTAQSELSALLRRVTTIIAKSVDGEDPNTADYEEGCAGDCSSCGGCH